MATTRIYVAYEPFPEVGTGVGVPAWFQAGFYFQLRG